MVTHNNEYQQFVVEGKEFQTFTDKWLDRVETYYKMNKQYYIGVIKWQQHILELKTDVD